jgi:hypothetical protein
MGSQPLSGVSTGTWWELRFTRPSSERQGSFGLDLVAALRVWRRHPFLPALSLLVWAAPALLPSESPWGVVAVALAVLLVGYPGTERIWYQRAFADEAMSPRDVWRSLWRFFWPFLRLAILVVLLMSMLLLPLALTRPGDETALFVLLTLFFLLTDVALTFVVPALTFSARNVREAARIGVAMIRDQWPRSAWYALAPPLAVLVLVRAPLVFGRLGSIGRVTTAVGATLMSLAFKGAIARFFLMRTKG